MLLVDELKKHGIEIVFLNRAIGVSPEEDLLLQMQGMFAEYERAKIMERSRRGKRHAATRGSVNVLSNAPYGYRYITKREGGGGQHMKSTRNTRRSSSRSLSGSVVIGFRSAKSSDDWTIREIPDAQGQDVVGPYNDLGNPEKPCVLWLCGVWQDAYRATTSAACAHRVVSQRLLAEPARPTTPPPADQISIAVPAIVSEELFEASNNN